MSCGHEIKLIVSPTDEACKFHIDVSAYKDRIVAPDEYSGVTEVTPSHIEQVLPTTDKLVRDDITVLPAPTEILSTDHNGTFTPSDGKVGFSQVDVNVNPDLRPLSVSENGQYSPDGFDGYSDVTVDVPDQYLIAEGIEPEEKNGQNGGFCAYWTSKYLSDRDETQYIYVMQFYGNPQPYGVQTLIYGARDDNKVIAIRFNAFRLIADVGYNDERTYALYASAGTIVKVYRIPKTTS